MSSEDFCNNTRYKWMFASRNYLKSESHIGKSNASITDNDNNFPLSNLFEKEKYFITRFNKGSRLTLNFKEPSLVSFIYFKLNDETEVIDNDDFISVNLNIMNQYRGEPDDFEEIVGGDYLLTDQSTYFYSTIAKKRNNGEQYFKIIMRYKDTGKLAYLYADVIDYDSEHSIVIGDITIENQIGTTSITDFENNPDKIYYSVEPSEHFDEGNSNIFGQLYNTPGKSISVIPSYEQDYQVITQYGKHVFIWFTPSNGISDEERETENFDKLDYMVFSLDIEFNLKDGVNSLDVNEMSVGGVYGVFTGFNSGYGLPFHAESESYTLNKFAVQKDERDNILSAYSKSKAHTRKMKFEYVTYKEIETITKLINTNIIFGIIDNERKYNQYTTTTSPKVNYVGVRSIDKAMVRNLNLPLSEVV